MADRLIVDEKTLGEFVTEFSRRRQTSLAKLRDVLRSVLERVRNDYAPTAVVETRVKGVASFAEKCLRKRYAEPFRAMTDQCAGRVVCPTLGDKRAVRDALRGLFAPVDEYENTAWRHDAESFGYLGYHMVVHFTGETEKRIAERWPDLAPLPQGILGADLKCEIQVRTYLEHAQADITHDRLYKSGFGIPKNLVRKSAMVAAQLESADSQLQRLVDSVDAYGASASASMKPESREKEVRCLGALLRQECGAAERDAFRLRLARLYRASWRWSDVVAQLDPEGGSDGASLPIELAGEFGRALFKRGLAAGAVGHADIARASGVLRAAADRAEGLFRMKGRASDGVVLGRLLHWLGETLARREGCRDDAIECFRRARRLLPNDPFVLTALVEEEWFAGGKPSDLALSLLCEAASRCAGLAGAGIDVVDAWLEISRIRLLQGDAKRAFAALAVASENGATKEAFATAAREFARCYDLPLADREVKTLAKQLRAAAELAASAAAVRNPDGGGGSGGGGASVVIFSGSTSAESEPWVEEKGRALEKAFDDFPGEVFSGGSPCGVCRTAYACAKRASGGDRPRFLGYLPANAGARPIAELDKSQIVRTEGGDYSILEPLRMWKDILARGLSPRDVVLVCLGGGNISFMEMMLALAVGADVYFLRDSRKDGATSAIDELRERAGTEALARLHTLPDDGATLAMFRFWKPDIPAEMSAVGEALAEKIHENYVRGSATGATSSNLAPWAELREDFKFSNRHQAHNAIRILASCGYGVRRIGPEEDPPEPPDISADVERMAMLEHGRWNFERLMQGWRYGNVKDRERRISPCIAPWEELAEEVRDYDRRAVRNWPQLLMSAGLAVTAKTGNDGRPA